MSGTVVFLTCFVASALGADKGAPKKPFVEEGQVCNLDALPVQSDEADAFLKCVKPDKPDWIWEQMGEWTKVPCEAGQVFSVKDGACQAERAVKRTQAVICQQYPQFCDPYNGYQQLGQQPGGLIIEPMTPQPVQPCYNPPCPQPQIIIEPMTQPPVTTCISPPCPQTCVTPPCPPVQPQQCVRPPCPQQCLSPPCGQVVQPRPCPLGQNQVMVNGMCSWMDPTLQTNPGDRYSFLQCAPAQGGLYCGRYKRMPCAPGTLFSYQAQVCVHDERPSVGVQPCNGGYVNIGQCNQYQQCPGQSMCGQANRCCQQQIYG